MSGKLVGEVGSAREAGHLAKLSQNETLALLAIAEKCHTDDRRGSVRMAYIQALVGKSKRTTERAVQGLRALGLIRIVQRGYKAHGVTRAPVYELAELPPHKMAETGEGASATQDGGSISVELPPFSDELPPKRDWASAKNGRASATQDGGYDGNYDGVTYDGLDDIGRTNEVSATEQGYVTNAPARCEEHGLPLNANGDCPRCLLCSGGWRQRA